LKCSVYLQPADFYSAGVKAPGWFLAMALGSDLLAKQPGLQFSA
jgi:hypothetical protein